MPECRALRARNVATLARRRAEILNQIDQMRVRFDMRIATFNVNGINGRLAGLLQWLEEDSPDVACLQELKAPDEKFPEKPIEKAGYGALWHGQKSWNGVAILAKGCQPVETHRALPGDPNDSQSRYVEAAISGMLIGCLYLPNGNPIGTAKF